jgi:hypothetical protein
MWAICYTQTLVYYIALRNYREPSALLGAGIPASLALNGPLDTANKGSEIEKAR